MAKQDMRARILDGAFELLDRGDYRDFTVDALARSVQMSKATFYRCFPNKEHLLETLINEACDATDAALATIGTDPSAPATRELGRLTAAVEAHALAVPRSVLHGKRRLPAPVHARLVVTHVALERAAARVFRHAKDQGWKAIDHPDILASAVVAAFDAALDAAARRDPPVCRASAVRTVANVMVGDFGD